MRKCPVDDFTLAQENYEGVTIDVCPHCSGVWLDAGELQALEENQKSDFRGVTQSALDTIRAAEDMARARSEEPRSCVSCNAGLTPKEYAYASQVIIDECPNGHGIWLDKGELNRLEMFFETESDLDKIVAEIDAEQSGLGQFLGQLWNRMKG